MIYKKGSTSSLNICSQRHQTIISSAQKQKIMNRLPFFFHKKQYQLLLFQFISTFLLIYGITASVYLNSKTKNNNPYIDILVGCFCYLGLSVSGKFSGAQMNPAITIGKNYIQQNEYFFSYIIGQSLGSVFALLLGFFIYDVNLAPYTSQENFIDCFHDMIGQIVGTFFFAFFIFIGTRKGYFSGQYFGYFSISASLLVSRAFTFRKGCLNPIIGFYSQLLIAFQQSNIKLIFYCIPVVIGPILGGFLAAYIFIKFYNPLILELKRRSN